MTDTEKALQLAERVDQRKTFVSPDPGRWYLIDRPDADCREAAATIRALLAEVQALRRDAERLDWLTGRLEDVQIDGADPQDYYQGVEEDVPYPVLWRRAIDAAMTQGGEK